MPNLLKRSYQLELLDRDDIPFADIQQNMRELDFINTWLGGHAITINAVKSFIKKHGNQLNSIRICEIGCGGGDNLRVIRDYCQRQKITVELIGVDINPHCIQFAQSRAANKDIQFIHSDYRTVQLQQQPDLIFSSLFCHHFTEEALLEQFNWMQRNAKLGFFVNDLQRHWLAYHLIKWLTSIFSKSYLVKHDAPLSVARGFSRNELQQILSTTNISKYSLLWKWAFRWLLIVNNA